MSLKRPSRPQDELALLNCRRLPARLSATEAAICLGFQEHDIPVLIAAKLLDPLGKPAANAPKYFATVDLLAHAGNIQWLSAATKTVAKHWQAKNGRNKIHALLDV